MLLSSSPQPKVIPVKVECPAKLQFLWKPYRYKVPYGGRGSAKSWTIARVLLAIGTQRPLRIVCGRETQKSIEDSVHKLLEDQVKLLHLSGFYRVQKRSISGANGTTFVFHGLKHNINNIKSLEGADIVWVEEAQTVSKDSWDKLVPTVRKKGSEIWVSYNPELETDETHQRFVIHPPPNAMVVRVNWEDNPWFPDELKAEAEHLKATDPDAYNHVYGGCCVSNLAGAIYAEQLRAVDAENRITRIPYDRTRPVYTFWDLGWGDSTSVWCAQLFPFEYRLIDFIQNNRKPLSWYLAELQSRGYVFGADYLPHDARAKNLGSGKSVEELMRAAGRKVQIVPMLPMSHGINAAREILPQCYFDADRCKDGLQALRRYQWGTTATTGQATREPLHDENSHAADAFRYFAVGVKPPKRQQQKQSSQEEEYSWQA